MHLVQLWGRVRFRFKCKSLMERRCVFPCCISHFGTQKEVIVECTYILRCFAQVNSFSCTFYCAIRFDMPHFLRCSTTCFLLVSSVPSLSALGTPSFTVKDSEMSQFRNAEVNASLRKIFPCFSGSGTKRKDGIWFEGMWWDYLS